MVFHGEHPFDSKISFIGKRQKKGHTYRAHQIGVEEGLVNAAAGLDDLNPAAEPDPAEPPPVKKQRSDNNWRVSNWRVFRAVQSLERKVKKEKRDAEERGSQRGMLL